MSGNKGEKTEIERVLNEERVDKKSEIAEMIEQEMLRFKRRGKL